MTQLIFDIGSNATKASLVNEHQEFIEDWRISTKLGKNILEDGSIDIHVIQNNISEVLKIIQEVSIQSPNISHHCIGTEALRKAKNREDIIQRFQAEGLNLDILTPDEEAMYERTGIAHSKTAALLPKQTFLLIDSGGSSTECSILLPDGSVPYAHSFEFGQHKLIDEIQNHTNDVCIEMLQALAQIIPQYTPKHIIAAGSSFTSYAMESLNIQNPKAVEAQRVSPNTPVQQPPAQAGQRLVNHLTKLTNLPIYVSTYGIRHGWIFAHAH